MDDLEFWVRTNPRTALQVVKLMAAVKRDPFKGIGHPEALKHELAGCWSRHVTQEHRIVYRVSETRIDFLMARYHYEK